METTTIVLSVLLIVIFGLFNFFGFIFIERLLKGKRNKRGIYALMAFINGVSSYVLMTEQPIAVVYLAAFLIMLIEILLAFDASVANVLYGTMAMLINSMCLHGAVSAGIAWISWTSLAALDTAIDSRLFIPLVTATLELLIVLFMLWKVPINGVNAAIKLPKQKNVMLVWMGMCLLFMFGNTTAYDMSYVSKSLFALELLFCMALLMSCYFMLYNSYKMNQSLKILVKNKKLSSELGNQKMMQDAFLKDSVFYIEVNLSHNRILSGSEIYMDSFGKSNFDYSLWFQKLEPQIHPDDREYFKKLVNRENLMELAGTGIEPPPFIYRRNDGERFRWIKMNVRLFVNEETGDTMGFGYSFDVDADINREKDLLEKSKTDGFTGLLNKATAQSMIREQVRHGVGSLYLLDIDNFKKINDTLGHEVGDQILKFIAGSIKSSFGNCDIVGRVGGDEFMAYCAADVGANEAAARAEELLSTLSDRKNPARPDYDFTASLGVALINKLTPDFPSAYRQADLALYDVKHSGKNSFSIYGVQQAMTDYA